jgi:hypothetical protein
MLKSGDHPRDPRPRPSGKEGQVRRKAKETRRSADQKKDARARLIELEDTKGGTTRNCQAQLVKKAAETALQKSTKAVAEKKRQTRKDPGWQLARILTKVVKGSSHKDKGSDEEHHGEKKKKKKKKKRKRHASGGSPSSPGGSSSSSEMQKDWEIESSSSSSSSGTKMMAPLRKKSKKRPGSVLQLLIDHARTQLDQTGKVGIQSQENISVTRGVKMSSYFSIVVKPSLGSAMAQAREMHHISQTIDLLRQGDLDVVGDMLAARFMSLHQSVVDGTWSTARHLELMPMEETTAAAPEVLLEAKRHARMASKLTPETWSWSGGGKNRGGRGRGSSWGDAPQETKGKGKKGPKGKGKGRGWQQGFEKDLDGKSKEKTPEK